MNKKTIFFCILTIVFVAAAVPAADQPAKKPDFSMSELKFEAVETQFSAFSISKAPGMVYIARFTLDTDIKFRINQRWGISFGRKSRSWGFIEGYERKILKTPTGEKLTPAQKEFVLKGYSLAHFFDGSEHAIILVTGVEEEQTRLTAVAFLECLNQAAEKKLGLCRADFSMLEKRYQNLVKELEPLKKKLKLVEEKYEKQKACTHYLTQEAAFNAIERMNAIFEENIIQLRVLKAKQKVITESLSKEKEDKSKESSEKDAGQPVAAKLKELLIDINIALAEVDATVQSAEEIRLQAEQFIRYEQDYSLVYGQYAELSESVDKAKKEMIRAGDKIASPSKDMQPAKVVENKITLQPVKSSRSRR